MPAPALRSVVLSVLVGVLAAAGCERFPRDPAGTLDRASGGTLRVGLAERPPFVLREGAEPAGVEVDLVEGFAREIDARVTWVWGSTEELLAALERRELDVVIAGLTDATPWRSRVALTRPYLESTLRVGAPSGDAVPEELEGREVYVGADLELAARVRAAGAVPVRLAPGAAPPPGVLLAAPERELEAAGYVWGAASLGTRRHVLAVPPGENAWLMAVERFLLRRERGLARRVRREARP